MRNEHKTGGWRQATVIKREAPVFALGEVS